MKRLAMIAGIVGALAVADGASAQFPGPTPFQPQQRPVVSPFINFFRGGSPSANFFTDIAPNIFRQPPAAATGVPDLSLQRRPGLDEPDDFIPVLPQTGHMVRFGNYGNYFNVGAAPRPAALNPARYPFPSQFRR